MSDLPETRSAMFDPPFTQTGFYSFGPITIKRGPKQAQEQTKVIFTCLTYRVIHLELAGDLSTDCFIMALQRFTTRQDLQQLYIRTTFKCTKCSRYKLEGY